MPTLNTKENFMRMINRQMPEYVPTYDLFWSFNSPAFLMEGRNPDMTGTDYFGVEWYKGDNPTGAALPKPGVFILDDITKWRDVIKVPSDADVDWEAMAKPSLDMRAPDVPFGGTTAPSVGFFEAVMSFMGFDEGLMACAEEPEEVKALLEYLCDWSVDMAKKFIFHYKPDFGFLGDDIAHERNPFISLGMFQDIFAPVWRRYYATFLEAGLPCGMHNCGHFELFLDDLVDMGVSFWDPVQSSNDILAIKGKFGLDMALCTGMENRFWDDDTTEEQVRAEYREWLNTYAPGGAFAVFGGAPIPEDFEIAGFSKKDIQRMNWTADEFEKLRYSYY